MNSDSMPATRPLLSNAARLPAAVIVGGCVVTTALLGASFGHGAHADRLDTVIDARVKTILSGNANLLERLAWLGGQRAIIGMTAVLVVVCLLWRRYRGVALAAISIPAAAVITERLLKPFVGRTSLGFLSFPSGHATGTFALATAITVLLAGAPRVPRPVRLAAAVIAFVVAAAVAAAMVALGFHYFTDAAGGAAVGVGTVLATALAIDLVILAGRCSRESPAPAIEAEDRLTPVDAERARRHEADARRGPDQPLACRLTCVFAPGHEGVSSVALPTSWWGAGRRLCDLGGRPG
jgi:membrane-associated phospholipid phosphatase